MQNQRICKYLIEKILGIQIEKITFPEGEKSIDNRYDSKSIRLDVYVHDESGHVYDIEMQCTNGDEGELPKRTRYYQGMIDMDELKKGQYYTELKESFIIRCIEKEGLELGDLSTKIFLNAKGESDALDPDIAAFLRYVDGKAAEGAFTKEVNEEVIRIKEHKEMRREYMTLLMELQKYKTEGMEEGIEIGMEKKSRTVIVNLLKLNMPIDNIAAATESPIPYVKEIAREAGYSV
ncbi:MAG: PD-(D/E)XK nuclease family transposase, partial [Dialister sp.]|nr:PD-(D/E)XK nuclease family transposase [Dialister sp.]